MATAKKENEGMTTAEGTAEKAEKKVKLRIPRTKSENDDVYVSVNDRSWLIRRGEEVEVPECVAEVLLHQEQMLEEAYQYAEAKKQG